MENERKRNVFFPFTWKQILAVAFPCVSPKSRKMGERQGGTVKKVLKDFKRGCGVVLCFLKCTYLERFPLENYLKPVLTSVVTNFHHVISPFKAVIILFTHQISIHATWCLPIGPLPIIIVPWTNARFVFTA